MTRIPFALVLLLACSPGPDWKPTRPGEIFRYTAIGKEMPLDSVVLGSPWSSAAKYGAADADTLFTLPRGAFSGADSIRVRRNASGVVMALEFDYGPSHDLGAIRRDYVESLGAPAEVRTDSITGTRTTTWLDAETEFRLVEFTKSRAGSVFGTAVLADRRPTSGGPTRS
jgi:hypothetical protein